LSREEAIAYALGERSEIIRLSFHSS
jgi:hypothetical protein